MKARGSATPARRLVVLRESRAGRFAVVGAIGVVVNTIVLFALVQDVHLSHLIGAAIATEVAIIFNFQINDRWTFSGETPGLSWFSRLARYNAVAIGGMLITLAVLATLNTALGLNYLIANLCAILVATTWNYLINSHVTWRVRTRVVVGTPPIRRVRAFGSAAESREGGNA
jgi:dolichol-phosphate mannosyltransferase